MWPTLQCKSYSVDEDRVGEGVREAGAELHPRHPGDLHERRRHPGGGHTRPQEAEAVQDHTGGGRSSTGSYWRSI